MFERQVDTPNRINPLYDDVERHYHVFVNITDAMEKSFMYIASNKACSSDATHICDQTCSDSMARPLYAFSNFKIPCSESKRHF